MTRLVTAVVGLLLLGTVVSCSSTETTRDSESQEVAEAETPYPSWYKQQTVVDADSVLTGYTTAIDSDSSAAVSKAVTWAETELSAFVATTLEEIRAEAGEAGASSSGLNDPEFILALAKNNAVEKIATTVNTEVEAVEGYASHRSYAKVQITKDALVEALDTQLNAYKKAWNSMKESQAFEEFAM